MKAVGFVHRCPGNQNTTLKTDNDNVNVNTDNSNNGVDYNVDNSYNNDSIVRSDVLSNTLSRERLNLHVRTMLGKVTKALLKALT